MADIEFAMWNCSGLLPTSSASEKIDFLQQSVSSSFDVLVLLETHHKSVADVSILYFLKQNYHILQTEVDIDDPYGGIIVLVHKDLQIVNHSALIKGRLLNIKLRGRAQEYNLTAVYGYTGKKASASKLQEWIGLLQQHHAPSDYNIILGDFNFVENHLDRTSYGKVGINKVDASLSKIWVNFTASLDLSDPFRVGNPRKRMFSYIHTKDQAKSRIDRIYVNDENCNDILHYRHIHTKFVKAHRIVTFSLKIQTERGPGFWKMNTKVISDGPYQAIVERTVNEVLDLNIDDPIERWLVFIETIRLETQVYCASKRFHEKRIKILCERKIEALEQNPELSRNPVLQEEYQYCLIQLNDWHRKQVDGHQTRIKTQPRFEYCEPNISFFADLEKKSSKKKLISQLMDSSGEIKHDADSLQEIAVDYYTKLFATKDSDQNTREKLLRNIKCKISPADKANMDKAITKEELFLAISKLKKAKSPGPDGIPAEFYQTFWHLLQDIYFDFIERVRVTAFPGKMNVSVTSLIFKERGEIYLLANYRPIALMNVGIKILTKLLSMRLSYVLPSIIHESQKAVYGRRIGDNINMVRDIIDLVNKTDEEACLLFLDQEKAFDRVSHEFMFSVLRGFGFGDSFIQWVRILYCNASTEININGFLTDRIPLKSGVRQGCPLSALLYVMVIEILALQLRANPNIVGFTVEGEKIVSCHYSDDAVIKITQNKCFKEVYKELQDYEKASGARINYDKSKGLWLGKWKGRKDDPFEDLYVDRSKCIKWTSGNVKHLGIYVGNSNPALQTFEDIIPKMKKRLHFWKPLKLPILAKARVIEIYHASKLFYAANFYVIPPDFQVDIMNAFMDYINFPKKKNTVSKLELEKHRELGGIKLINIKLKAETPKIEWLMRLLTDDNLRSHASIFKLLVGPSIGRLSIRDIIFAETSYIRKCSIRSPFYSEALLGISRLITRKHYVDIKDEIYFYNPILVTSIEDDMHDRTIKPFRGNRVLERIRTYGELLQAESTLTNPKLVAAIRRKLESIHHIIDSPESHIVVGRMGGKEYKFETITQKQIYFELVVEQSRDHAYITKWRPSIFGMIDWDKVWNGVHNQFFTEVTKSSIWEQLHLNFYTTYNYNVWHNSLQPCPLCRKIPEDVFHIITTCKFTNVMWKRVENLLFKIIPKPVTPYEKAFGLQIERRDDHFPVIMRNWITFLMRHLILQEERRAYSISLIADPWTPSVEKFFKHFNHTAHQELAIKKMIFDAQGLALKFEKIVTVNGAVATLAGGEYSWNDIM